MHGARVIALRGNFDQALALVRELVDRHPIALVNSVNQFRLEGQKTAAFEILEELGEHRRALHPGRQRRQHHRLLEGLHRRRGPRAADARLPGRGRRAARARRAGREPGDGRERDPDRQPGALGGGDGRDDRLARRRSRAVTDAEILDAYRFLAAREGVFCEPASAAGGRRAAGTRRRAAPSGSSACSPATGSRTRRPRSTRPARSCRASRSSPRSSARSSGVDAGAAGSSASRPPRPTSGRASTCSPPRSRCTSSSRSWRPAASRSRPTSTIARDRRNLVVRGFERLHPPDDFDVPHPLRHPALGRPGHERRGVRRRA